MAKADVKAKNNRISVDDERWVCSRAGSEKVSTCVWDWWMKASARIPTNRNAEPKNVYRKNLTAAYARRSWPHPAMMKYDGIRVISKKKKKTTRSRERKLPMIAASSR